MAISPSPSPSPSPEPSPPPPQPPQWPPSPSPSPSPTPTIVILPQQTKQDHNSSSVDFSPPLIAMVVVVAAAFLMITYSRLISRYILRHLHRYRLWRHRRRSRYLPSSSNLDSPPPLFDSPEAFHVYSPYGLEESVIKTLPLYLYTPKKISSFRKDCAVCLLEFEENDYVRTLPICSHAFHVDCIDIWLRSHANCPLCRSRILSSSSSFNQTSSPRFVPIMAARIRPSLDDNILRSLTLENIIQSTSSPSAASAGLNTYSEIIEEASPRRNSMNISNNNENSVGQCDDHRFNGRDFLLKKSYSFGFERSLAASERMLVTEPATASPWRSYRRGGGGGSFWSKRPSPFSSLSKHRVFSFRYYRGMKSPFFRRRSGGGGGLFFPLSERFPAVGLSGGGGGSSRRSKSMASPMFLRSSVAAFSSSRLRCGDPEALLSPERFNSRR